MPRFKFTQLNNMFEIPDAEFNAAVLALLRSQTEVRRGQKETGNFNSIIADYRATPKAIFAKAHANIPAYSVFTVDFISGTGSFIDTGTGTLGDIDEDMGFDARHPKVFTRIIDGTEEGPVFLVNEQRELIKNSNYMLDVLGDDNPALVTYDPDDGGIPNVGDALGPKANSYLVSLNNEGLIAVSGPDVVNDRIWVVRVGGTSEGTKRIRFEIASVDGFSAVVNIRARPHGINPVPEEVNGQVTVWDACQCHLGDEPPALLIGRCGYASYMDPDELGTGTGTDTGISGEVCQWEIDHLCCAPCG